MRIVVESTLDLELEDQQDWLMPTNTLTEDAWKTLMRRHRVRDNGLQRALASYEHLDADNLEERLEALDTVSRLATALRRVREIATVDEIINYLENLARAAASERRRLEPQATRARNEAGEFRAWADLVVAADRQKPDFAKLKNLLNELGTISSRPIRRRAPAGPAKGGGSDGDPCGDLFLDLSMKFGLLAAAWTAACLAAGVAFTEYAAALQAVRAAQGLVGVVGETLSGVAGAARRLALAAWKARASAIALIVAAVKLFTDYWDAFERWDECCRRRNREEALAETDRQVREQARQMRARHAQLQQQLQRLQQLHSAVPNPPP